MRFANPAALWLGLLALPILALHVLRPRRPTVEVSSVFLWRSLAEPVSAAAPWQRLRPSALLFLQLLAVALLTAAAAQPVRLTGVRLARHTVFIVDASGSMAAIDGRPDRLAAAKARAAELRLQLPTGGVASVVVANRQPRVVLSASSDRTDFAEAVAAIRTTAAGADWDGTFSLAESLETPGAPVGFVLLSDGGLDEAERRLLPPGTTYERVGSRSTNRAITRLTVEPRGVGLHARISVANTGGPATTQQIRFDVDGRTAERVGVTVAAGATEERDVDLPSGGRVDAYLEGEDLLAADNHAYAVAGRRRALRVLLAGPDNVFLERLLAVLPGVRVERSTESRPAPGFDLAIYDQVNVPIDPAAPVLAIRPPGGLPGVAVVGEVERPAVTLVRSRDELLSGLDLAEVAVARAQKIDAPGDEILVGAEGAPLLIRGSRAGRPFAYLTFALHESTLGVQVAFPILADRLLTELAGAGLPPLNLRVGQVLPITVSGPTTIDAPAGRRLQLAAGGAAPVADRAGFWKVRTQGRSDVVLAVNAEPGESTLTPAKTLVAPTRSLPPGQRPPAGERPQLPWVVGALLTVLIAEALLSRRRRGVPGRQWRVAMGLRMAIGGAVLLAMVGTSLPRPARRVAVMFLIDASDSLGPGGRAAAMAWTQEALAIQPAEALAGVAMFGGDARLELTMSHRAQLLAPGTRIDASRTDLAGALRLGAAVLPTDARRRIVVVSDGRATEGDAATEARRLRQSGIDVDFHATDAGRGPDAAVTQVDAPSEIRPGESFTVRANITATQAGPLRVRWSRNGQTIEERAVDLPVGQSVLELAQQAGELGSDTAGLASYRIDIDGPVDAVSENNVGYAGVRTRGAARVLVAEGMAGEAAALTSALRSGGISVDVVAAAALPPIDQLAAYAATVLVDVDARSLANDQVAALGVATRDLGRGLVVVGGDRSYALGGYLGSDLEKLLPVVSDVTDPKRRSSVAQVLAIDSSGSMGACHCAEGGGANGVAAGGNLSGGGVNKTDISRAAAARTISALSATDQIGVLAFNTEKRWIVPLQALPAEEVVTQGLRSLKPAGGTDLTLPLVTAGEALAATRAKLKHIILFTDGFTSPEALAGLVEQASQLAAQGITVSVLATGETGAAENLSRVAEAGRGRFYNETDLAEVPQIMAQEAVLASRRIVNEGEVFPQVVSSAAVVRDLRESPPLLGYLGSTTKPAAQTLLEVGEESDPLLASWQAGLGKVTAWTSDASARWSQRWADWSGYIGFWSMLVKDTFPLSGATNEGDVRARVDDGKLRVTVEAPTPWADGATAVARVAGPDLVSRELRLERTSGTTFVGEASATQAGTYTVGATVSGPEGNALLTDDTVSVASYSAEYEVGAGDPGALSRVSALAGGRGAISAASAFDSASLRAGRGRIPLAGWLLSASAVLWPLAVALSRLSLHGSGVTGLVDRSRRILGRAAALAQRGRPRLASPSKDQSSSGPASTRTAAGAGTADGASTTGAAPPTIDRLLRRKRGDPAEADD